LDVFVQRGLDTGAQLRVVGLLPKFVELHNSTAPNELAFGAAETVNG
jgi:hypothetical protein